MSNSSQDTTRLSPEEKRALLAQLLQKKASKAQVRPVAAFAHDQRYNTRIESLGVYLPAREVSTEEIIRACHTETLFPLEDFTGIKSRRMAAEGEYAIDLAKKAIEACFANSAYQPADIDLLICANCSRCDGPNLQFSCEPSTAIKLKQYFGLDKALVFDITNACAGMFTAIFIADALLKAGLIRRALIASGEYITHLTQTAQQEIDEYMDPRLACLTLGDAGAAIILGQSPIPGVGFHQIEMYTVGQYSSYCVAGPTSGAHGGAIMFTEMGKLTTVGIEQSVAHTLHMLEQHGQSLEAFQHIIPHQTSKISLDEVAREINRLYKKEVCREDTVICNLARRGNTASTSHFVALRDSILSNKIHSGESVIFSVTASGLNVGTALYTFDDLPDRLRHTQFKREKAQLAASVRAEERPLVGEHISTVRIESVGIIRAESQPERDSQALIQVAVEDCLGKSAHGRQDIDLLIHTGMYRTDFIAEPALAAIIAGNLQINSEVESQTDKKTFAFDLLNGALGTLNACYVASGMLQAGKLKRALIVASEIENNYGAPTQVLRGLKETSSALILETSADGKEGFGAFLFQDFADYIGAFTGYTFQENRQTYMHFEHDSNIEHYYLRCIRETVNQLLAREQLTLSQVNIIFPPQISATFLSRLSDELHVSRDKFVDVTADEQDLFTSSLMYAFQHAREQQQVKAGDIGLIINVGTGIQVGCAVYYF